MKTKTSLIIALFAATALSTHAQTSVPTPRSVAPDYTPPQNTTGTPAGQTTYTYQAPHAGTWDFYITTGAWIFDDTKMAANNVRLHNGPGGRASGELLIDMDDAWLFGFGAGYNLTERFSIHGRFDFASPDYDGVFTTNDGDIYRVWGDADIFTGEVAARFDLMTGKIRPFIQGSAGFMYIDTGIPNGRYWHGNGGYWNDWYEPTVGHTYFNAGATAGISAYFSKYIFGQLSYTLNWANTSGNGMMNHRVGISIGWNY